MKRFLSVCLALVLLLACVPVYVSADATPTFAAGTATAAPGETVEIPILVENNPGIVALHLIVSFDTNVLTLQNAADNSLFSGGIVTFGGSYATNAFGVIWEDGAGHNHTDNGTLATLTFLVAEDAPAGDTAVTVSYKASSVFNEDLNNVTFDVRSGAVTVAPAETGGWSFAEDCDLRLYEGYSGETYVTGLDPFDPVVSVYVETTGGWTFEVIPNGVGAESTGAKLVIYDENGDAVEEYYTVMIGDINGDCIVDLADMYLLSCLMGFALDDEWAQFIFPDDFPQSFAADADHNLVLNGNDAACMLNHIAGSEVISQIFV